MSATEWEATNRPPLPQPTYGKIAEALAKAQGDMSNPTFDAQNPHFRNRYASLAAVRNAIVPVLSKHGICVTQDLSTSDRGLSCVTTLTHLSGERMVFGPLVLPAMKQDAQGYGSCATYARRYALMAVAGVVGDDDDDAESAVGRTTEPVKLQGTNPSDASIKLVAANFKAALKLENDQKIFDVHSGANADKDLYAAAWKLLDSKERASIKEAIDRVQGKLKPQNGSRGAHDVG